MFKKKAILGEYIAHLVLGAVMFTALLVLSGMVNLAVHWIGNFVGDPQFAAVMTLVERVMLYSDVVFLVWWTVFSTYKAIKESTSRE